MKRILSIILAVSLLMLSTQIVRAGDEVVPTSGVKTADALITTGVGQYYGIVIASGGTVTCTASIYDNTSATGTKLVPTIINAASNPDTGYYMLPAPISYFTGIYVDITTSGSCAYSVLFRAR